MGKDTFDPKPFGLFWSKKCLGNKCTILSPHNRQRCDFLRIGREHLQNNHHTFLRAIAQIFFFTYAYKVCVHKTVFFCQQFMNVSCSGFCCLSLLLSSGLLFLKSHFFCSFFSLLVHLNIDSPCWRPFSLLPK